MADEFDKSIFSAEKLLARPRSTVKRNKRKSPQPIAISDFEIDAALDDVKQMLSTPKHKLSPHSQVERELTELLTNIKTQPQEESRDAEPRPEGLQTREPPPKTKFKIDQEKFAAEINSFAKALYKKNTPQSFRHYKRYAVGAIMTFVSAVLLARYKFTRPPPPTGLKAYLDASIQSTTDVINALPQVAAQLQHYVPFAQVLGLLAILVSALGLVRYWPVIKSKFIQLSKRHHRRPVPIRSKSRKSK